MKTAKKRSWLKTTIVVFLLCGIVGTILSAILFFKNPGKTYASARVQFSFDGAAEGLAPDRHHFDVEELGAEEVISAALTDTGLSGQYTPEQIRDSLIFRGVYPEDIVEQVMSYESLLSFTANRELTISEYHPTVFDVRLTNEFDPGISRGQLTALLQSVMEEYQRYFALHYAENFDTEYFRYDYDSYDYPQQLEAISETMAQVAGYADELYQREPAFTANGISFNDISIRLANLTESDITRLSASITMNALTKDVARLLTQYQYQTQEQMNNLTWQRGHLTRLDELIASYEKNEIIYLSTADSLTKIDGNSSETYDALVDARKAVADQIVEINSLIANYQLLIADLSGESPQQGSDAEAKDYTEEEVVELTEEEIAAAAAAAQEASARLAAQLEKNIDALLEKRDAVFADFRTLLSAYNAQEINSGTVTVSRFDYESPSLFSGAFIVNTIKTAGPFCAVGLMVCLFLMIRSRRKEEKTGA